MSRKGEVSCKLTQITNYGQSSFSKTVSNTVGLCQTLELIDSLQSEEYEITNKWEGMRVCMILDVNTVVYFVFNIFEELTNHSTYLQWYRLQKKKVLNTRKQRSLRNFAVCKLYYWWPQLFIHILDITICSKLLWLCYHIIHLLTYWSMVYFTFQSS